jgi:mannose-6-phosphate isomerase-like protein (cupin superfamily)
MFVRARERTMPHVRTPENRWSPQNKNWGTSQPIHRCYDFHLEEISILAGGYCSWHKHLSKHNRFFVSEGTLLVVTGSALMKGSECWVLSPGETCLIENHKWHIFAALWGPVRAQEVYTRSGESIVVHGDIFRASEGGVLNLEHYLNDIEKFCQYVAGKLAPRQE